MLQVMMAERKKGRMNENKGIQAKTEPERISTIYSKVQGNLSRPKVRENHSCLKLAIRGSAESSRLELNVGGPNISTGEIRIQAVDVSTAAKRRNEYNQQGE
jgi:hypothetical protein